MNVTMSSDWRKTHQWTYDMFDCMGDTHICMVSTFLPCVTSGDIAVYFGKNRCLHGSLGQCFPIISCFMSADSRGDVRAVRGIPGDYCTDLCLVTFCTRCALIQEGREVARLKLEERMRATQNPGNSTMPMGMAMNVYPTTVTRTQPTSANPTAQHANDQPSQPPGYSYHMNQPPQQQTSYYHGNQAPPQGYYGNPALQAAGQPNSTPMNRF